MSHASYTAADITRAARRCAELAKHWPHWPRARVRRLVAIELGVRTTTLRYLLRQAEGRSEPATLHPDGLTLAA